MVNPNILKAQKKAAAPEARAKAAATMKRNNAAKKEALAFANAEKAAKLEDKKNRGRSGLLKHAKMVTKGEKKPKKAKVQSIPLDMIPDAPPKKGKYKKKVKPEGTTRQEVVLALLKYLNGE